MYLFSVVALSESEPYGVRGGSLVVLFAPAPNSKDTPVKVLFSDPFSVFSDVNLDNFAISPDWPLSNGPLYCRHL